MPIDTKHEDLQNLRIDRSHRGSGEGEAPPRHAARLRHAREQRDRRAAAGGRDRPAPRRVGDGLAREIVVQPAHVPTIIRHSVVESERLDDINAAFLVKPECDRVGEQWLGETRQYEKDVLSSR